MEHLVQNELLETYQSAYRKGHSVETAVLSVVEGLLKKFDEKLVSLVAFLDLSAVFDTLDHSVLLKRLDVTFGLQGTVLSWIKSYVSDRTQCVTVGGKTSDPKPLLFGVPQGSVLGPLLFSLYVQPLSDIIEGHNCDYHKYADDTELSKSAKAEAFDGARLCVKNCVNDILCWMDSNKLKLNTDKTEVLAVGDLSNLGLIGSDHTDVGDSRVPIKSSVKYLGVTLDQTLSLNNHISKVSSCCQYQLRRISSIRKYLTQSYAARLASAMVLSRLDYCNSLFASVPKFQLERLHCIQNHAARVVMKKRMRDHVTPLLRALHWLPIEYRCQFKIATLAYRHFEGTLPKYLSSCLTKRVYARAVRSASVKRLEPPKKKPNRKTVGGRAFGHLAPAIWNSLPVSLRGIPTLTAFRKGLKTYLFRKYLTDFGAVKV